MSRDTHAGRWATLAVVMGALVACAEPAWGLPGLEVVNAASEVNDNAIKQTVAFCPAGKRVVGGGGWAVEFPVNNTLKPTLTELRPLRRYLGGPKDAYRVTAATTTPGTTEPWQVQAYAVCAKASALGPWSIRSATSVLSSSSVKAVAAVCPTGRRVLGTGISISDPFGEVVIQVARPSRPGDIARAQAREDVDGYAAAWSVTSYAICATRPDGYVIPRFARSVPLGGGPTDSPSQAIATAGCPRGKFLLSAGGALDKDAPGSVSLQGIFPTAGIRGSQAIAAENTPTSASWGFMVASAVCAS